MGPYPDYHPGSRRQFAVCCSFADTARFVEEQFKLDLDRLVAFTALIGTETEAKERTRQLEPVLPSIGVW